MSKRCRKYERRENDFYPTPLSPIPSLIPHLRGVSRFSEPCAGDGSLVRHLKSYGLRCVYAGDIATGQDALALDNYGDMDVIITNPPYERKLMHKLIAHFERIAPTWLLLEYDWTATKQAWPFMKTCSDVVVFGRMKWIPGTPSNGMDNFCWCKFDAHHSGGPILHNAYAPASSVRRARLCDGCSEAYRPQRSDSKSCSDRCRQRVHRQRVSVTQP